jgi:uncharacterized protein
MKKTLISLVLLLLAMPFAAAQQSDQHKLVQFHMTLLKKTPKWNQTPDQERGPILKQHLNNILALMEANKLVIAGPLADDGDVAGIMTLRTASPEEANSLVSSDPAVKAGLLTYEIHPWWAEDIFKKANSPLKMTKVYLGFLRKGPNRKEGDGESPEVQQLQKAHLANINRLAELKKLVLAGPFGDNGDLRGIFVFRVDTLQEAQDLSATDPMIKINRLKLDLHPWMVPEGVLP